VSPDSSPAADAIVPRNPSNSPDDPDWFDEQIIRFDRAWHAHSSPRIEEYLAAAGRASSSDDDRTRLLVELVLIDMEARWQAAYAETESQGHAKPAVEDYLSQFPKLGLASEAPLAIVANEFRLRYRKGERPQIREFERRFGWRSGELAGVLHKVLQQEEAEAIHAAKSAAAGQGLAYRCPQCRETAYVPPSENVLDVACPYCGQRFQLLNPEPASNARKQFGRFELIEHLGQGTFGDVWKARDTESNRIVALKIAHRDSTADHASTTLLQEAKAAALLRHPCIVPIYEIGREEGRTFVVAEFVEGVTLEAWAKLRQPTFRESAVLCHALAEALHYAHEHEQRIVHRDVKPSNILIDSSNRPHLTDFGLAKREAAKTTVAADGRLLGTLEYMSPEQARGQATDCDRRSDVYSLGVVLFELLTGELPFRGSIATMLRQIADDDPPHPRKFNAQIPKKLATISLKCMEKSPRRRYATAQELADDLSRFLAGEPIKARPRGPIARAWRWARRNPFWVTTAAFVVLATTGLIGGLLWHLGKISIAIEKQMRVTYVADLNDASARWHEGNWTAVQIILGRYLPGDDTPDVRDFSWYYLADRLNRGHVWLDGHRDGVTGGVFSPDGKLAATTCIDGVARVFDTTDGRLIAELPGHGGDVNCALFITNKRLLTGADDGLIRFWNVTTTAEYQPPLKASNQGIMYLASPPDGRTIAFGGWDGGVLAFDLDAPNVLREITRHTSEVRAIGFVPGTRNLISLSVNGPLRISDFEDAAKPPTDFDLGSMGVKSAYALAIRGDGGAVALSGNPGTIKLLDLKAGDMRETVDAHAGWIKLLRFIDEGRGLISAGHDNRVNRWEVTPDGDLVAKQSNALHGDAVFGGAVSPDEAMLLTCSRDRTAQIWKFREPRSTDELAEFPKKAMSMAISADGELLAVVAWQDGVWLWKRRPFRLVVKLSIKNGNCVTFARDGSTVAVSTGDDVLLWSVDELKRGQSDPRFRLGSEANSLAFDPSGEILATTHDDGYVRYWRAGDGSPQGEINIDQEKALHHVEFGLDRSPILHCNLLRYMVRRENLTGEELWRIGDVDYGPAFTSDRNQLAYSGMDLSIRMVDAVSGDELKRIPGFASTKSLAFSTDDRVLAATSEDGALRLWAVDCGRELATLAREGFKLSPCVFAPDGRTLYAIRQHDKGFTLVSFPAPLPSDE
jgi:WD40 repeat protein/tRNA A-37 threonylcarbamoyl transferase component Bud32/DNA-directed RNA polymerase subunit RPC12/RpoP